MIKKSVLNEMMCVVLLLLGTTAMAQQSERLPVMNDQQNVNRKQASQAILSQAQVIFQPHKALVAGRGSGTLASGFNILVNNNNGATSTAGFTQSETSVIAFGNNVVIGYNDAGSLGAGSYKFAGWSYSSDGGATFTDWRNVAYKSTGRCR